MDSATAQFLEPKLDAIIRLLAAPIVEGKPIAEAAPRLAKLGLDNNLIATICDTSPTVVRTAISRASEQRAKEKKG